MEFLYYQNTIYFLAFAIISGIMLLLPALRKGGMGQGAISAREAVQLNNSQSAQFIDIRPYEEFAKGSVAQAKSFPKDEIENKISTLPKKPLILICSSGRTAQQVAQKLKKHNIEQVYWLKGGINDWIGEGLPVKAANDKSSKKAAK